MILKDVNVEDLEAVVRLVARDTHGLSGAELKELCRDVLMAPMREMLDTQAAEMRPLTKRDFTRHMKQHQLSSEQVD